MKAPNRASVDANILLRYLVRDVEDQWAKSARLIEAMAADELEMVCDPVTLAEVVWTLRSFYRLDQHQIREGLEPIVAAASFRIPDKSIYLRALDLYGEIGDFGDACACAMAMANCEGRLLSFDKKLTNVQGIRRMETPAFGEESH